MSAFGGVLKSESTPATSEVQTEEASGAEDEAQTVSIETSEYYFGKINVPYADFYYGEINHVQPEALEDAAAGQYDAEDKVTAAGLREEGIYDSVTSATSQKSQRFEKSYFEQNGDGTDILGPSSVNVAIPKTLYDDVKAAIRPNTKMFFIETPTNPMMKVADNHALSEIAKGIGALTVVDNTFLTPYFQKPLQLGADIVTHSSTKYLGGHNDTISGIVVVKDNEEIAEKIHVHIKSHGSQLAPLDSWLILRGIKTLAVRMDRHNENAKKVAEWLRTQPKVQKVYYVGFEDHKDYAVTKKQTTGFGGMISFTVDSFETVKKILKGVDMIMFAESLGGTETLITYPTTQTHEDTPLDIKEKLGITDCFLRMSVGIENADDIIADLDRAMNA